MGMTVGIHSTEYFGMTSFIQAIETDPNTQTPDNGENAVEVLEELGIEPIGEIDY